MSLSDPALEVSPAATVLVVEDHDLIRRVACETLEAHGYRVVAAETPARALEILAARGDIEVVFADLDGRAAAGGMDLLRLLVRQAPWVAVVATSCSGPPDDFAQRFLPKPYGTDGLLARVDAAVRAARPRRSRLRR